MALTIGELTRDGDLIWVRPVTECNVVKLNCEAATRPCIQEVKREVYVPEKGGKYDYNI